MQGQMSQIRQSTRAFLGDKEARGAGLVRTPMPSVHIDGTWKYCSRKAYGSNAFSAFSRGHKHIIFESTELHSSHLNKSSIAGIYSEILV